VQRLPAFLALFGLLALGACGRGPAPTPGIAAPDAKPVTDDARSAAPASRTLAAVRARGTLRCGINPGLAGFAFPDNRGAWRGFDVDFCRALAAAVLGDAAKVTFVPLSNAARITALKAGQIDVLARNTSWTFSRDAGQGVDFAGISYYDGQGFMAARSLNLQSAAELGGARICVQSGTTSELNLRDFFQSKGLTYAPVLAASEDKARSLYEQEACDALSADISSLASTRSVLSNPGGQALLADVISKEPMGPVVRQGDPGWTDIVRWTLNALVLAEELGVTAKTAEQQRREASRPEIRRLLGVEPGFGAMLGLSDDWAFNAIRQVGNYGEIFERNVGARSALKLERGQNALWNANPSGLLYAPPMR
jgi:general L-amino acid transport system substrate-binding protein